MSLAELRRIVAEEVEVAVSEDMKNIGSEHKATVDSSRVLTLMHAAPGLLPALQKITSPAELAHLIEAIIDSVPVVKRADVMAALGAVQTIANQGKRGIKPGEVFARVELGRAFVEAVGAPSGFVLRYKPARGRMSQLEFTGDSYGEQGELWTITQVRISGQA